MWFDVVVSHLPFVALPAGGREECGERTTNHACMVKSTETTCAVDGSTRVALPTFARPARRSC